MFSALHHAVTHQCVHLWTSHRGQGAVQQTLPTPCAPQRDALLTQLAPLVATLCTESQQQQQDTHIQPGQEGMCVWMMGVRRLTENLLLGEFS